jgi:hypothetical protein
MTAVVAVIAGVLFGTGLLLSGMTNPANVIAFLDVAGAWRPALAFTMAAAIAVPLPAYALVRRRGTSLRREPVPEVQRSHLDWRLLLGSGIFGVGWGLSGICPGPGIVLLASGALQAFTFVAGVIVGSLIESAAVRSLARIRPV